jgi:hypothetical protein
MLYLNQKSMKCLIMSIYNFLVLPLGGGTREHARSAILLNVNVNRPLLEIFEKFTMHI